MLPPFSLKSVYFLHNTFGVCTKSVSNKNDANQQVISYCYVTKLILKMAYYLRNRRNPRFEESADDAEPLISRDSSTMNSNSSSRFTIFFSKENIYRTYVLSLFLITYLLNQLDRYMLAIVTKPLAQVMRKSVLQFAC